MPRYLILLAVCPSAVGFLSIALSLLVGHAGDSLPSRRRNLAIASRLIGIALLPASAGLIGIAGLAGLPLVAPIVRVTVFAFLCSAVGLCLALWPRRSVVNMARRLMGRGGLPVTSTSWQATIVLTVRLLAGFYAIFGVLYVLAVAR